MSGVSMMRLSSSFSGSGEPLYVALWGGAGSHGFSLDTSRKRIYNQNPSSGSGGLLLAKVTGVPEGHDLTLYVGGQGRSAFGSTLATEYLSGPYAATNTSKTPYAQGCAGGAASALSVTPTNGTEQWLLIAPGGGGGGGIYKVRDGDWNQYLASSTKSRFVAGHGTFTSSTSPLGRATVAKGTAPAGNQYGRAGARVGTATASAFSDPLTTWAGDGYARYYPATGSGGAPDGAGGTYTDKNDIGEGGEGGHGYVSGFSGTYSDRTYGTGSFGSGITIEFVAFDGMEMRPWIVGSERDMLSAVAALRGQTGDAADLVTEITNALGWNSSPSTGKAAWPPVMQDLNPALATFTASPEVLDLSTAAERDTKTDSATSQEMAIRWPGQGPQLYDNDGSNRDDDYTTYTGSSTPVLASNTRADFPHQFYSNGGAAMIRVGSTGTCVGYESDSYLGAYTDARGAGGFSPSIVSSAPGSTEADGVKWLPTQSGASASKSIPSSTIGTGGDFGSQIQEWVDHPYLYVRAFDPLTIGSPLGPMNLEYDLGDVAENVGGSTSQYIQQIRDNDAELYTLDLYDTYLGTTLQWQQLSDATNTTGWSSSSGNRRAVAFLNDLAFIQDDNGLQLVDQSVEPPVIYNVDRTGAITTLNTSWFLTIDEYNYGYVMDADGKIDVHDLNDLANNAPVILSVTSPFYLCTSYSGVGYVTNSGRGSGLTYDHINKVMWYSYDDRISWMFVERDVNNVPTGFRDHHMDHPDFYIDRATGSYGNEEHQIYWTSSWNLLERNDLVLQMVDASNIRPTLDANGDIVSSSLPNGDFVFSMWGAGGAGGGKDDSATQPTEDGGPGGCGAFVEVRVQIPEDTQHKIKFGLGVGGSGYSYATGNGGGGGSGGGATVLYIDVDGTVEPIAFVGSGGGGGGSGRDSSDDAGFGGSAAGVDISTGVGYTAQNGYSPNESLAGEGGTGASGTAGGTNSQSINFNPPAKSVALNGQRGGSGGRGSSVGSINTIIARGPSFLNGAGGHGGDGVSQEGGGGGGGGGFWAGAGGGGAQSGGNDSGAGGGGGSSNVRTGTLTINGESIVVSILRSDSGTSQTGSPTSVTQLAGSTNFWNHSSTYGQGGNGAPETHGGTALAGDRGQDGAILAGWYDQSSPNLVLTGYSATPNTSAHGI